MLHELSTFFEGKAVRRIEIDDQDYLYIKFMDGSCIRINDLTGSIAVIHFKGRTYPLEIQKTEGKLPKWLREKSKS